MSARLINQLTESDGRHYLLVNRVGTLLAHESLSRLKFDEESTTVEENTCELAKI